MNSLPVYEYAATIDGDLHIVGWCRKTADRQPVEVLFKSGEKTLFAVTANREVDVEGSKDEPCGFDITLDSDFWIVFNKLDVCTPAGNVIASLEKPLVRVKKRSERAAIEHKFDRPSLLNISGTFRYEDDGTSEHYVKLFSKGKLEAYLKPTVIEAAEQGDEESREFRYRFIAIKDRPFLDRLVFVVVDDGFAFVTRAHAPVMLKHDPIHYVLPLPIDLSEVVGMQTFGTEAPQQSMLYGTQQYLGWGWGSVLVFDRQIDLKCAILLADGSSVRVRHENGNLGVAQLPPRAISDA